jgi:hypothetical protein
VTPEQEDEVRRILAEVAHESADTVPPDVAARLDATLADLVRDRDPVEQPPRIRRWPRALAGVAAAAVVLVGGVSLVQQMMGPGTSESAGSTAAGLPERNTDSRALATPSAPNAAAGASKGASLYGADKVVSSPVRLHLATLQRDLQRLAVASYLSGDRPTASGTGNQANRACLVPSLGPREAVVTTRLDGKPVSVVLGPVRGGSREASVYSCTDAGGALAAYQVSVP